MQKFKRLIASFMMALSLLAITPMAAHAEWRSNNAGWWYTEGNSYATGWKNINGNWYYFYSDGYMAHDEWIGDYYLGSSGAWTTGSSTTTTTSSGTQNNQSQTVYVSRQGIYHKSPTAHGMKYYTTMSRSEAENEGNRACKICY